MAARLLQPPFVLDRLIAEAKRRARQRRVAVTAVVAVLAVAVGGTMLAVHPYGWFRASQPYAGPLEPGGMVWGPGNPSWPAAPTASPQAVSAASGNVAWMMGNVAWRWNGRAWRSVPLPRNGKVKLWSVAARAPDDAWAVGQRESAPQNHALIEHWNGARWSIVRLPRLPTSSLYGVAAAGPRSAWAVGATFRWRPNRTPVARPLLLHWDGTAWRRQPLPWADRGLELAKVVATGPSSIWVVTTRNSRETRIEYWDGTGWRLVHAPFGSNDPPAGFSATSWNDAWAVGSFGRGGNRVATYSHALAAHWNGSHWQITPAPNPPGDTNSAALVDVSSARPNDALAGGESQRLNLVGANGANGISAPVTYFLHWNGQDWQAMPGPTPPIHGGVSKITAASDGSAWALGNCVVGGFSIRWTGAIWAAAPPPPNTHWRCWSPG